MKAKTFIELLTLSSNLYLIAKDKDMLDRLSEMAEKGKTKINDLMDGFSDEGDEETFFDKLISKTQQAKEELEKKMEEIAVNVYRKVHIAHTDEVKKLSEQIEQLRKSIGIIEARVNVLEDKKSAS